MFGVITADWVEKKECSGNGSVFSPQPLTMR